MSCLEFRRAVTSDPQGLAPELAQHAESCNVCAQYAADITALDNRIADALKVPVPTSLLPNTPMEAEGVPKAGKANRRWYALAASIAGALALALLLRNVDVGVPLHSDLIAHIYHEPDLLTLPASARADQARLENVLRSSHVSLKGDIGDVAHAGLCYFRGNLVAHLIINSPQGPITVLLLPDEKVSAPMPIDEDGFVGTIVPLGNGSIAVVGEELLSTKPVEQQIVQAVEWSI